MPVSVRGRPTAAPRERRLRSRLACHPDKLIVHMPTPDLRVVLILPAVMVSAIAASRLFELKAFNEKQPFVQTHGIVEALDWVLSQ